MEVSQVKSKAIKSSLLIVAGHDGVRNALRGWLSYKFDNCNIVDTRSWEETINFVTSEKPNIVLMDIYLPDINGIEATRLIKNIIPKTHVVILGLYDFYTYRDDAIKAGASALISKQNLNTELVAVLTKLLSHLDKSGEA